MAGPRRNLELRRSTATWTARLRRQRGATAQLIAYERPDLPGQKESRYRLVAVEDPDELEAALAGSIGISATVRKSRRLFLLEGVRIHLDSVDGLGSFIEFEAVADPGDEDLSRYEARLADLRRSFGITDADLVRGSYCDLIGSATDGP